MSSHSMGRVFHQQKKLSYVQRHQCNGLVWGRSSKVHEIFSRLRWLTSAHAMSSTRFFGMVTRALGGLKDVLYRPLDAVVIRRMRSGNMTIMT